MAAGTGVTGQESPSRDSLHLKQGNQVPWSQVSQDTCRVNKDVW